MIQRRDTRASLQEKMKRRKRSSKGSFSSTLGIDFFKESFRFNLPNGKSHLSTSTGAFFSIVMIALISFYGIIELHALFNRKKTNFYLNELDGYFEEDYAFDMDK